MEDAEGFSAQGERAAEAWAPAFEPGSADPQQVGAGPVPLGFQSFPDALAQGRVFDERGVLAHDVQVAAGEGCFDVGDEVVEERTGLEMRVETGDVGVRQRVEGSAGPVPSRQVKPRLGP